MKYNLSYIKNNAISKEKLKESKIDLVANDEIFVRHPEWNDYYISQYGRAVSIKNNKCNLLNLIPGGGGYYYYKFVEIPNKNPTSISAHRAVADVFCPNFWQNKNKNQLQAHHFDHSKINNYYKNLILLPTNLHNVLNRVKDMVYLYNGRFEKKTPYEIMDITGLTLDEIVLSSKGKPIKSQGKYSVFEIKGHLIGFCFIKKQNKRKK